MITFFLSTQNRVYLTKWSSRVGIFMQIHNSNSYNQKWSDMRSYRIEKPWQFLLVRQCLIYNKCMYAFKLYTHFESEIHVFFRNYSLIPLSKLSIIMYARWIVCDDRFFDFMIIDWFVNDFILVFLFFKRW